MFSYGWSFHTLARRASPTSGLVKHAARRDHAAWIRHLQHRRGRRRSPLAGTSPRQRDSSPRAMAAVGSRVHPLGRRDDTGRLCCGSSRPAGNSSVMRTIPPAAVYCLFAFALVLATYPAWQTLVFDPTLELLQLVCSGF